MKPRRKEPCPSFVTDDVLRRVADYADDVGIQLQKTRPNDKRHYQFNQVAHWLWRISGAEPSDLEPKNEETIRRGPKRAR